MRSLLIPFAVVALCFQLAQSVQGAENEIRHQFSSSGHRYVFTGGFWIHGKEQCLMEMLYDYSQLKRYARHADSVKLDQEGDRWQIITYEYKKMFYHARSTFKRTLEKGDTRIDYHLVSIDQGGLVSPDIQSISGYYDVSPEFDGYRVTFHQEGVLGSGMLTGFYFYYAEKEAVGFVKNIREYALKHCR